MAVGDEVGAAYLEAVAVGEVHLNIAVAAGELRGRADPIVPDAEPETVEELDRGRPHPAHLPAGVEPHRREPPVLGSSNVASGPRRHVAPILQTVGDRERRRVLWLGLGRGGDRDRDQRQHAEMTSLPERRTPANI